MFGLLIDSADSLMSGAQVLDGIVIKNRRDAQDFIRKLGLHISNLDDARPEVKHLQELFAELSQDPDLLVDIVTQLSKEDHSMSNDFYNMTMDDWCRRFDKLGIAVKNNVEHVNVLGRLIYIIFHIIAVTLGAIGVILFSRQNKLKSARSLMGNLMVNVVDDLFEISEAIVADALALISLVFLGVIWVFRQHNTQFAKALKNLVGMRLHTFTEAVDHLQGFFLRLYLLVSKKSMDKLKPSSIIKLLKVPDKLVTERKNLRNELETAIPKILQGENGPKKVKQLLFIIRKDTKLQKLLSPKALYNILECVFQSKDDELNNLAVEVIKEFPVLGLIALHQFLLTPKRAVRSKSEGGEADLKSVRSKMFDLLRNNKDFQSLENNSTRWAVKRSFRSGSSKAPHDSITIRALNLANQK